MPHAFSHIRAIPPTAAGWLLILLLACACIPAAFSPAGAAEETPPPADSAAPDTEDSGPEQAVYPDVLNEHIQRGDPASSTISCSALCRTARRDTPEPLKSTSTILHWAAATLTRTSVNGSRALPTPLRNTLTSTPSACPARNKAARAARLLSSGVPTACPGRPTRP